MKYRVITLAACVLLLGAGAAAARDSSGGTVYVEPRGGVAGTSNPHVNTVGSYGGAAGYYVMDGVALEAEGMGYAVTQQKKTPTVLGEAVRDENASAVSVAAMARWDFLRAQQGTLFVGAGGGGVFSDKKLPAGGETTSGMGQADLGGSVSLGKNVSLKAAGRFQHIGSFSGDGLDSLGGNVGLKISF